MHIRKFNIILSLIISSGMLFSESTIITESFYSNSLGENKDIEVYLPDGYDVDEDINFPVIYFLHGFGGDESFYPEIYSIMDGLVNDGSVMEMIVVKPDGGGLEYDGSFYTNSELNGAYEDYIAYDLVDYIDNTYRTLPQKDYRALSGHSMGGYGTMKIAMKHTNIFSSLSSHSGPISLANLNNSSLIFVLQMENLFGPFSPNTGPISAMLFAMSAAFSPNLDNPPYFVDLPISSDGDIIDDVFDLWMDHDPLTMIELYEDELHGLNIYFDCGTQDELLLYSHSTDFSDRLNELGIDHTFDSYTGGHSDQIINRLFNSLQVHSDHFGSIESFVLGDLNQDAVINILDIVIMVNIALGTHSPSDQEFSAADINSDDIINILDIVLIVNLILEN